MAAKRKKRIYIRLTIAFVIIFMGIIAAWMIVQWLTYKKTEFRRYAEFGIAIPSDYMIHGIDVSRYQQTISWEEVRNMRVSDIAIGFAFIKATEGISSTDPQFKRNWKKARASGITRGAYHFFIPSRDGRLQAEHFISKVDLESGDMPPVLDIEQISGTPGPVLVKELKEWLDIVENHYRVKPIIYTNIDFYKRWLGNEFDDYPLWVAHYYEHKQPRINRGWIFWQHNDGGNVSGINAKVDFNVFNGDSASFRELLIR